jgi:hypothetical protein
VPRRVAMAEVQNTEIAPRVVKLRDQLALLADYL